MNQCRSFNRNIQMKKAHRRSYRRYGLLNFINIDALLLRKRAHNSISAFMLVFIIAFFLGILHFGKNSRNEKQMFVHAFFTQSYPNEIDRCNRTLVLATWIAHSHSYRMMLNRRNNEIAQFVALNNAQMNKHEYSIMIT